MENLEVIRLMVEAVGVRAYVGMFGYIEAVGATAADTISEFITAARM